MHCGRKSVAVALGALLGTVAVTGQSATAGLARLSGGSGYSGALSSNKAIRRQQLICDPNAPVKGSTSVAYNPGIVSLSGLQFASGYNGTAMVEEEVFTTDPPKFVLQSFASFLRKPAGTQTGYVQVDYTLNGTPAAMTPPPGFITYSTAGVAGTDTHALVFTYLPGVADSTVATYTVYADPGARPSSNTADFLTGTDPNGRQFTLGPTQLAPATVSASLDAAVPLPSAALTGGAMLALIGGYFAFARRAAV